MEDCLRSCGIDLAIAIGSSVCRVKVCSGVAVGCWWC